MIKKFIVAPKRLVAVSIGNILLGIGIGIFKYSNMGNDPFSAMALAIYQHLHFSYAVLLIIINVSLFLIQVVFGRKYIGVGTVINGLLVGYVVQLSMGFLDKNFPIINKTGTQIIVVIIGVIITGIGLFLYQSAEAGIAPYDSLALIVTDYSTISYFQARMFFDAICALIAYAAGGILGLGTLVCVLLLGPIVSTINKIKDIHISG